MRGRMNHLVYFRALADFTAAAGCDPATECVSIAPQVMGGVRLTAIFPNGARFPFHPAEVITSGPPTIRQTSVSEKPPVSCPSSGLRKGRWVKSTATSWPPLSVFRSSPCRTRLRAARADLILHSHLQWNRCDVRVAASVSSFLCSAAN